MVFCRLNNASLIMCHTCVACENHEAFFSIRFVFVVQMTFRPDEIAGLMDVVRDTVIGASDMLVAITRC